MFSVLLSRLQKLKRACCTERFTGSLGLEFAARVSEKSRREGQLVFPEETYGQENAKILVEKFVSITSVGDYFQVRITDTFMFENVLNEQWT